MDTLGNITHMLDVFEDFFIFNLSGFSKNKWLNQKFREMYIWRRTLRRQEFMRRGARC
jgi:hypothetical protein